MHGSRSDTNVFYVLLPIEISLISGHLTDSAFCFLVRHIFYELSEIHFLFTISDRTSSLSVMSGLDENALIAVYALGWKMVICCYICIC